MKKTGMIAGIYTGKSLINTEKWGMGLPYRGVGEAPGIPVGAM
jgi:hypothetical protein